MKKINNIGLGTVEFIEYGYNFSLELLSVYNQGEFMGKIICKGRYSKSNKV
ncbi:hypothetical protein [Snodgrassella sp. ESL0253]|uniref:hypothetical protein n=1 Tax=Snodgrassella sp. ESL0253 TaxID=2705031 RepID=UPI0015814EE6|nr:hypothetical protein [Snodgrassella sp. ESL0253]NUE67689.1 hypothetical protein [Snodgrassella sp. ESL0253]